MITQFYLFNKTKISKHLNQRKLSQLIGLIINVSKFTKSPYHGASVVRSITFYYATFSIPVLYQALMRYVVKSWQSWKSFDCQNFCHVHHACHDSTRLHQVRASSLKIITIRSHDHLRPPGSHDSFVDIVAWCKNSKAQYTSNVVKYVFHQTIGLSSLTLNI